jgi:branched-chain amino acid transport system ATP-binding protein
MPTPAAPHRSSALLETIDLRKRFGGVCAVDTITLSISAGELRCIIGPNGAGKSTFFQLLSGRILADSGRILYDGQDITASYPFQRARRGIAVKVQGLGVYSNLTVEHNLAVPLQRHLREAELRSQIAELLPRLGLAGQEQTIVRNLSHGQRQWLALGMALATRPRLLLLDEPTAGMSPEETRLTGDIVKEVNGQGVAVIVIEHDMAFVRQLNAPVTVLHYGRVFAQGTLAEIESHEDVRHLYLGTTLRKAH